jgi:hypothetical protein
MLSEYEKVKASRLGHYEQKCKEDEERSAQQKAAEEKCTNELQAFKDKVQHDEYQKELLFTELPEFIEQRLGLTGVYVGYIKHPPKEITDEDEDDSAHLDTSQPKMINYIGSSASH